MKRHLAILLGCAIVLPGCAQTQPRVDYSAYASYPVAHIDYTHLYNWQRTNDNALVVWTKPSSAYLVNLRDACRPLGLYIYNPGGVETVQHRLAASTDEVIIGDLHCRVESIQPLDMVAMRADRGRG